MFPVISHGVSFVDCASPNHVFVVPKEKWHERVTKVLTVVGEAEFAKLAIKRVQMSHPRVQSQRPFCGAVTCRDVSGVCASLQKSLCDSLQFARSLVLAALLSLFTCMYCSCDAVLAASDSRKSYYRGKDWSTSEPTFLDSTFSVSEWTFSYLLV
jgi:hypothetical protein